MKKISVVFLIVLVYLSCLLIKIQTQDKDNTIYNCTAGKECIEIHEPLLELINIEREKIYKEKNNFLIDVDLKKTAFKWAKTQPESWNYDSEQCKYLQQGVSYWEQTNGSTYTNVPISAIVHNIMYKHQPTYTCGLYILFDYEKMKHVKRIGIATWAENKTNHRNTGLIKGVQVWVFVHYELPPGFVPPILYTKTPPPNPDETTTKTKPFSTITTSKPTTSISTTIPTTTANPVSTSTPITTAKPITTTILTTTAKPISTSTTKITAKPVSTTIPNTTAHPISTSTSKMTANQISTITTAITKQKNSTFTPKTTKNPLKNPQNLF